MRVLRTPDERLAELPDFAREPGYVTIGAGLRMAFVEAGPSDGEPILLLHGEPTWSFLYRSVIASLAEHGLRAIAPDLVGFGRSDKPTSTADHSYARHVDWVREFVFDALGLTDVTLELLRGLLANAQSVQAPAGHILHCAGEEQRHVGLVLRGRASALPRGRRSGADVGREVFGRTVTSLLLTLTHETAAYRLVG